MSSVREIPKEDLAGTIALLFWCLYAIPLWALCLIHFKKKDAR
jgi:hypothetical protein